MSITQCASYSGRLTPALPLGMMFKLIAGVTLVLTCFVAHLNLRFSINRLRSETIRLQTQHTELLAGNAAIVAQNEAFKQPDRLLSFARHELGMVPLSPADKQTLTIPAETHNRYALARAARQRTPLTPEEQMLQQRAVWLAAFGERVGLQAPTANAGESIRKAAR